MTRPRFSDPHPDNVTIPPPPGHQTTIRAGQGGGYLDCACGWSSGLQPTHHDALVAYDAHIDTFGDWCDFCGGLWPIVKEYPCKTFSVNFGKLMAARTETFVYEDGWSACSPCSQLVDAGEWFELAVRAVESSFLQLADQLGQEPKLLDVYRKTDEYRDGVLRIRFLHQCFQKARSTG